MNYDYDYHIVSELKDETRRLLNYISICALFPSSYSGALCFYVTGMP